MISDAEFVAIRSFDRTLTQNTNNAQRIINDKNTVINTLEAEVIRLRQALESECGKRKLAEYKLMRRR